MADTRPVLLVVDDDEDELEILSSLLGGEGFSVVTAAHGQQALEQLAAGLRPQAIILDLMMPVMSGWHFWDQHQTSPLKDIPVIVMTATGIRTGSVGSALVLAKPIDHAALLAVVRSLGAPPLS